MYGESSGLFFPYLQQTFPLLSPEPNPLSKPPLRRNVAKTCVSEYNLGGEGDLFKAPEPIMEEPELGPDPITFVSMITSDEDITTNNIKVSGSSSTQSEHLLSETFTLSDYNTGGARDQFKAAESIMEEPPMGYDPVNAAFSRASYNEDDISAQVLEASDIRLFLSNCALSDSALSGVFSESKDLIAKTPTAESLSNVVGAKVPSLMKEEGLNEETHELVAGNLMQRSVSSGYLSSVEWINYQASRLNNLDYQTMDIGADPGMRRAFSEGDMQTLNSVNTFSLSTSEKFLPFNNHTSEDRKLRLSRYRIKKSKRNFGRKIKYACRKVLADNQPRVRGRFAKPDKAHASKTSNWDSHKHTTEKQLNDDFGATSSLANAMEGITVLDSSSLKLDEITLESFLYQEPPSTSSLYRTDNVS